MIQRGLEEKVANSNTNNFSHHKRKTSTNSELQPFCLASEESGKYYNPDLTTYHLQLYPEFDLHLMPSASIRAKKEPGRIYLEKNTQNQIVCHVVNEKKELVRLPTTITIPQEYDISLIAPGTDITPTKPGTL